MRARRSFVSASRRRTGGGRRGRRPRWLARAAASRQFVALNDDFPRLRVSLEMMGPGNPRILEWQLRPAPFEGIGTLRFHRRHNADGARAREVEHTAIIDLQNQTIVSVQVHRQGDRIAKWTWEEGRVLVASADGITDELQLRQMKPKEPPPVVAQRPAPRKPKNFFEPCSGSRSRPLLPASGARPCIHARSPPPGRTERPRVSSRRAKNARHGSVLKSSSAVFGVD